MPSDPARSPETARDAAAPWLLRIPEVFAEWESSILDGLGARLIRRTGGGYRWVEIPASMPWQESAAARMISWNLPLQHSWPCRPLETPGFVEQAAQALVRKFAPDPASLVQGPWVGPLDAGAPDRRHHRLASNLRGRLLQCLALAPGTSGRPEEQDPQRPALYVLVGASGLFAGVQSPLRCGGFHPGGVRFFKQSGPETISRAGAKIAAALHHLGLYRRQPEEGGHWLELGASPGGMTADLLRRGFTVTAIDRAPLDARLTGAAGLRFHLADAAEFAPDPQLRFDALLSDLNGDPRTVLRVVARHARQVRPGGLLVVTLKLPDADSYPAAQQRLEDSLAAARAAGLVPICLVHLPYNRREFTLMLESPQV